MLEGAVAALNPEPSSMDEQNFGNRVLINYISHIIGNLDNIIWIKI